MAGNLSSVADLAKKKAFEICYALFRISSQSGNSAFSTNLEHNAAKLLSSAIEGDVENAAKTLEAIEYFLRLASSVGLTSSGNTDILIRESGNLKAIIAGLPHSSEDAPDPEIQRMFPVHSQSGKERKKSGNPAMVNAAIANPATAINAAIEIPAKDNAAIEAVNAAIDMTSESQQRKGMIIDAIRQSGNCRLKDLQAALPGVSDRTLRYDLEVLIGDGVVERIGSGPSTYYRVREIASLEPIVAQNEAQGGSAVAM